MAQQQIKYKNWAKTSFDYENTTTETMATTEYVNMEEASLSKLQ